jgi:hypothetical protein
MISQRETPEQKLIREAGELFSRARTSRVRSDRQSARRVSIQLREMAEKIRGLDRPFAVELLREAAILGRFT